MVLLQSRNVVFAREIFGSQSIIAGCACEASAARPILKLTTSVRPPQAVITAVLKNKDYEVVKMSFYFAIVGTKDNPLFEHEFGSSKQGGDGLAKFPEQARHMNQFIVHSSLDIVEEVQWGNGQLCVS